MKAPSPIAIIRSVLGPEQAEALLRGGIAPESLARTVLEATAPADLAATLAAAGLEKAEPLSARTVLAVQNLVRLNQMRADRAIREVALGKAEGLEKRSKNVRNWTRYEGGDPSKGPLKGSTIDRRQSRYMRGLGLDLDTEPGAYQRDEDVAPTPRGNILPHARTGEDLLTLEHEGAHALMTPPDKKMSRYFRWLHGQNELERTTRHQRSGRGTRAQQEAVEEAQVPGSKHEHIAQAMSPGIQRRSGVAPGAHRNFYPHDDRSPEEYQEVDKLRQDVHGRKAKGYLRRWDEGMRFDKEGVAIPPTGLDAAINQRARIARRPPKMTNVPQHGDIPAHTANIGGGPLASSVQAQLSARMHSQLPHQGETTPRRPPGQPLPLPKSERSPKLPPDQHGIGPKHEPEEKIAPTKQLEPQVHQNHGAKRLPAALEKRSKNVKEQTTGITKLQAHRRRQQYARSLGLDPQNAGGMAELRDLKGKGNELKYGGKFDLPHELGHAMQTRPGGTLSEHMAGIAPDDQFDDDTINTALEHRIDRRAGVDPHKFAGEFRGTIGDPDYSPPDDDFAEGEDDEQPENEGAPPIEWNADLLGRHGRQNRTDFDVQERLQQQADRAEHANSSIGRFDLGHRFDPSGKLRAPEGIDAKINRRAGILKSEIGRPVDVKTAKPEKVKKECPVYQHIRDAYQAEDWSKARDLQLETEGNSTWIMHNGKGLKLIPGIGGGREKARAYIEAARQRALKETINKSDVAEWRSRPVLRAEDAHDLDHAAAARSLSSGSAQEGERQAYEEYSRQQRLDAMAHHFRQAGEAQKRGDRPTSDRHMLAYTGHARALGIDPAGHPPPEVGERIRQLAGKRAAFRGHPADRLA